MEDFNSNYSNRFSGLSTATRAPTDLIKLIIIEARYNLRNALEFYIQQQQNETDTHHALNILKSRLVALLFELKPVLKRSVKPEEYDRLVKSQYADEDEVFWACDYLNELMDKWSLIKIDTDAYDMSDPTAEDEAKGLF